MLRRFLVVLATGLAGMSMGAAPAGAVSGGSDLPAASAAFVARVNVGGVRACTGALVAPQWVLTATSCFAADGESVITGVPPLPTTVTVGGTDYSVPDIYPHAGRNAVLVHLGLRVIGVTPVALGGTAPATGDQLQVAGQGRTATEWVPDRPAAAPVAVGDVTADTFGWTASGASACRGDLGGPVLRTGGAQPELVGLALAAGQGGCLAQPGSRHDGTAVRVDDLQAWVTQTATDYLTTFRNYFNSATGIGGYDLAETRDLVVPFDYDHSGKLDHLVLYRPGAGIVFIVKHNTDGSFTPVISSTGGIGGYDLLSANDRIVPFDYDHTGKLDHLLMYRPGSRIAWVLEHGAGTAFTALVHTTTGIGEYDLADPRDQVVAYDYDHSGKLDPLMAYRPGAGNVHLVEHGTGTAFTSVVKSTGGIGGYDLLSEYDRAVPFDYDHTGKLDHLLMYRPGSRIAWVLEHGAGTAFTALIHTTTGIGGYDLADHRDQVIAYDYEHTGRLDHLVLYRPGAGIVHVVRHGAGTAFAPVLASTTGIGGYDLLGTGDRIAAYDQDHAGGPNHLFMYRPGSKVAWVVGRQLPPVRERVTTRPATIADSIVEDFAYPGAADILATRNVRLISGDGHIVLADCATVPVDNIGVIKVWTTEPAGTGGAGQVCFQVTAAAGRLDLEVPGVYEIRGDGQRPGYGHQLTAVVDTETGAPATVVVNPSGSTQVGIGANPANEPTTLLQLRVPA